MPPLVQPTLAREIAPGVKVLPDQHIDLVPNIGSVIGTYAVLVVDCGMGRENGQRVLHKAREMAGSKPLLLTTTHFHPEHAFGSQAFKGHAIVIANTTRARELREKGAFFLPLFRDMEPDIKEHDPQWGNDRWIPFEIRNVYAEVTGKPLDLPTF
jgi:glyoxylase-like metal-dependent hydrolase (beta-lactamase superfamily II)